MVEWQSDLHHIASSYDTRRAVVIAAAIASELLIEAWHATREGCPSPWIINVNPPTSHFSNLA